MMYHVTYLSGGFRVKGYLCLPNGFSLPVSFLEQHLQRLYGVSLTVIPLTCPLPQATEDIRSLQLPAFLYCRGGINRVGRVKPDWVAQFANQGFVVFAPAYRGNEGGEGRDEFGGAENEDVREAYRFLSSLPFVDENQISIMGFSRGAVNAAQTAVQIPAIHKLVLWGGVSDLAQTYEERMDLRRMLKRVVGGTPAKVPEAYQARSPIHLAGQVTCPVLIMHGTEDVQVDFSHGLNMYRSLQELGADVIMHTYEGYGHHLPAPIHAEAIQRMMDWVR
ncbi:alpha/beta hydrolase family protein [Ectobacillus ponti]|uniref:Prolyl oligopeptidase family serine peptidase n=1 Tax=Ectobacillus ponti TaxID=2961894 RepID=A0AA41X5V9_9BACI|nr:prolyl oligopeptidase family serine peptidase [Ectobacillus ponti]MCP8969516.1 prolyl oligopeptidase family serine peptidase [Ectobacillus ponti]